MEFNGLNLCDFCFEEIEEDSKFCPHCGLNHEKYNAEAGLLMPGAKLKDKYIIGRVLGRGGFGATYLAFSNKLNRPVAIKEYFPTGIASRGKGEEEVGIVSDSKREVFDKGAKRFFAEAKTMAKFNADENVVTVYEFFYANDTVYYAMEYLDGIDLKGYVQKEGGKLSENKAITILKNVCRALMVVHSTGTLHRDISPDNIFICRDGRVKLIDFGAAKQVVGEHTQQNYSVVVKQGFAPAEQYKSDGNQGNWTDIYAVGATIYYAVTGQVPMDSINRMENPDLIFNSLGDVSPAFANILNKCLKPKISERYQNVVELMRDIEAMGVKTADLSSGYVQSIYQKARWQGSANEEDTAFVSNRQFEMEIRKSQDHFGILHSGTHEEVDLGKKAKRIIIAITAVIIAALVTVSVVHIVNSDGPSISLSASL